MPPRLTIDYADRMPWLKLLAAGLAAAAFVARPADAWTPATQEAIAETAARLAPPDLRRQIEKHRRELREGALAAFRDTDPAHHVGEGAGRVGAAAVAEAERAVALIRAHQPFADIVRQLGVVSHYVADANNPLGASSADGEEPTYFADYLRYAESAQGRFAIVFYGLDAGGPAPGGEPAAAAAGDPPLAGPIGALLERALVRGSGLYPLIGREYRRIRAPGAPQRAFDDRSTAFGVATIAFNQAVSDSAVVMRWIWLAAGGGDERWYLPARGSGTLVALPGIGLPARSASGSENQAAPLGGTRPRRR